MDGSAVEAAKDEYPYFTGTGVSSGRLSVLNVKMAEDVNPTLIKRWRAVQSLSGYVGHFLLH